MLKKIASNTLSQVFSKVLTATISIILIGLLTKYLTVELYGTYSKVYNYAYIFAFLVDLGLYTVTIKEISANKDKTNYIFGNILTLRLFSGILVLILSILIAFILPGYNSPTELYSIFILGFFTIFSLLNSSFLALMQAYMKIEFSIISIVTGKLLILFLTFLGIYYIFPLEKINGDFSSAFLWIIFVGTLGMFLNMVLNYFYANKITKIKFLFDYKYIKHIFKISIPYGIALFLGIVYTKIDIVLLSLMESGVIGERSIALYSLPLKIMDVFMMIGAFFLNSLLPIMSESYKKGDKKKIKEILENGFKVLFASSVGIVSLGLVFKDHIIKIIATPDYLEVGELNKYTSSDAFSIVLFILLFFYISLIFSYLLIACEKQARLLKISIILTIVNIVGNVIMIPYFSFIGAGIVTVFTQILFFILGYFNTKDIIKIDFPFRFILFILSLGFLIYFVGLYFINKLALGLYFDLIYGVLLFGIYAFLVWTIEMKKIKMGTFKNKNIQIK